MSPIYVSTTSNHHFLYHWKVFEEHGFDVIGLLKQIAVELYKQLHITAENDRYLLRRATERYFIQLENHLNFILDAPGSSFFIREHGTEKYHELLEIRNEYRKLINAMQRAWIGEQNKIVGFYKSECNSFDFRRELHNIIESSNNGASFINMDKLSEKFKIPNWKASNFLVRINFNQPKYYEYKDKKYLIANPYLILNSKAEELKCLLIECNNNETITRRSQASSLLTDNGIPKDCHCPSQGTRILFCTQKRERRGRFKRPHYCA